MSASASREGGALFPHTHTSPGSYHSCSIFAYLITEELYHILIVNCVSLAVFKNLGRKPGLSDVRYKSLVASWHEASHLRFQKCPTETADRLVCIQ